ncbi:hypothetical protein QFC22_003534 [Naganishia vaughanmartiniae]|uniref:Uncharacterized protein n=1 Tax=Naganishia vaughanmartiniae TaxID=1424756 RepID=A0ACC2X5P8_9TREE|nr:hypothetical protein QFC22_003534 [Naganishia vaughanmartiniae]
MFAKSIASVAVGAAALFAQSANAQVTASGTMGSTNPPQATMGTPINQTSYSRLLSANSIDDFCIFAPPEKGVTIGDSEAFEVAWCTKARNNARVIPDGVLKAVHFIKTPLYVQVQGWGDFTQLNIASGDLGGELDPHGATGDGNPVGGNVTSNVSGTDVHYEEWMNYMSDTQFCLRICTAENATYSASLECQHTLDEMGCEWVMPGDYTQDTFTSCDGDSAYPPGIYPLANGSTSTFAQRYTGTYIDGASSTQLFTVGQTVTPPAPYSTPATSNCQTFSSIGNGIASLALANAGSATGKASGSSSMTSSMAASSSGASSMSSGSSAAASRSGSSAAAGTTGSTSRSGASAATAAASSATSASSASSITRFGGDGLGAVMAVGFSAFAIVAGAGAFFL